MPPTLPTRPFLRRLLLPAAGLLFCLSPLPAQAADPFQDPLILEIQQLHDKSAEGGDKAATTELVEKLEKLTAAHPDNCLLLAYLGSAYTLACRDAFPGPSKLAYLKKGLKTMDDAVGKAPNDPAVRFIRAVNNYNLPAIINRRDNARNDFELLVGQIDKDPSLLAARTRQAIYYYAGLSFRDTRHLPEAKKAWEAGLALDDKSDLAAKIAKELKKLGA
jgi:hypothetical protein